MKIINNLFNTEIVYAQCFSAMTVEQDWLRFIDSDLPDMYMHNFLLLNQKQAFTATSTEQLINQLVKAEQQQEKNGAYLIVNQPLNQLAVQEIDFSPQITEYCYLAVTPQHYQQLAAKLDCITVRAATPKVFRDGEKADIQANEANMGAFAAKRIKRKIKAYQAQPNLHFYVCYYQDKPIGTCELLVNKDIAKIEDFDIIEDYQRQGFGTALLRQTLQDACLEQVKEVYLVTDQQDTAKEMYFKCGFTEIGKRTDFHFSF